MNRSDSSWYSAADGSFSSSLYSSPTIKMLNSIICSVTGLTNFASCFFISLLIWKGRKKGEKRYAYEWHLNTAVRSTACSLEPSAHLFALHYNGVLVKPQAQRQQLMRQSTRQEHFLRILILKIILFSIWTSSVQVHPVDRRYKQKYSCVGCSWSNLKCNRGYPNISLEPRQPRLIYPKFTHLSQGSYLLFQLEDKLPLPSSTFGITPCVVQPQEVKDPPRYTMGIGKPARSSAELKQWASTAVSTAAQKVPEQWLCSASGMHVAIMHTATGSSECQVLF